MLLVLKVLNTLIHLCSILFMKFGIIGSGDVGRRLAEGLVQHGHYVGLGTRNPEKKRTK